MTLTQPASLRSRATAGWADGLLYAGVVIVYVVAGVRAAASVPSALQLIEEGLPDVLLPDIAMPAEDGYALLRELRARGVDVPAIALTAHAGSQERRRALGAGFAEHVGKPFDLVQLVRIIRRLAAAASSPASPADPGSDAERQ